MTATKAPSIKQLKNEEALRVYAAALCILIVFVAASRRLRAACNRHARPRLCRVVLREFRRLEKRVRCTRLCPLPVGLLVLLAVLAAINAALCFTVIAGLRVNFFASRLGWLAVANMALCVLMALRTTALSSLALVSHTHLNLAHRILGYAVAVLVVLHAVLYTVHFGRQGRWHELIAPGNVQGFSASAGLAVLLVMGYLRHGRYELFYATHVAGFWATLFFTALHRPDWAKKLPLAMTVVLCMWLAERAVRAARMAYYFAGQDEEAAVALYPLAQDGVRLVLRSRHRQQGQGQARSLPPGSHCFLWIPRLGLGQSHPFTVVSSGPWGLELVIQAREGFTRRLADLTWDDSKPSSAAAAAVVVRCASVDGPYGLLPDLASFEKLVLVAGGSGAAFTVGLMNRLLASPGKRKQPLSVDFVWAVKQSAQLDWFRQHLVNFENAPEGMTINVTLFVTGGEPAPDGIDEENAGAAADELDGLLARPPVSEPVSRRYACTQKYGAVDTDVVLWDAMQTVGRFDRSLVATCGPPSMVEAVWDSVEAYRAQHLNRIVNFHSEDFS